MRIALVLSIGNFFCFPSSNIALTRWQDFAFQATFCLVAAIRSPSFDSLCAETAQIIVTSQSQVRVDSN